MLPYPWVEGENKKKDRKKSLVVSQISLPEQGRPNPTQAVSLLWHLSNLSGTTYTIAANFVPDGYKSIPHQMGTNNIRLTYVKAFLGIDLCT